MRVYLPVTVALLREAIVSGEVRPVSGLGFAVTPSLIEEYVHADEEELEYLAMVDAGRACLRLLAAGPDDQPWLRVVIAADVADATPAGDLDRAAVRIGGPMPWSAVAAVHVDGADAADAVRTAAAAVDAADLLDPDAEVDVGEAEDIDLGWYAPGEARFLLEDLDPSVD